MANAHMAGRVMKVNHAGEQGTISIYSGQILMARCTAKALVAELKIFKRHEEGHRTIFQRELGRRGLKRCKSYWLCAMGGYALGIGTGLLGSRAISLTTVAVERVVLRHLRHQITLLAHDADAVAKVAAAVTGEFFRACPASLPARAPDEYRDAAVAQFEPGSTIPCPERF